MSPSSWRAATSIKLAIELDGDSHLGRPEYDEARDQALAEENWLTVRFMNHEVIDRPSEVAARLLDICRGRPRYRY